MGVKKHAKHPLFPRFGSAFAKIQLTNANISHFFSRFFHPLFQTGHFFPFIWTKNFWQEKIPKKYPFLKQNTKTDSENNQRHTKFLFANKAKTVTKKHKNRTFSGSCLSKSNLLREGEKKAPLQNGGQKTQKNMSFFRILNDFYWKSPHKYRLKSICWPRCRWNLVPTLSHSQILLECHRVPILSHLSGKLPNCPPTRTGKSPLRTHQHPPPKSDS